MAEGVDHSILERLQELVSAMPFCLCFTELLEGYRTAFCSACISCDQVGSTVRAWQQWLRDSADDLSISASAMHCRVAAWVSSSWTAEWLLGEEARPSAAGLAFFRQSREVLVALDFGADCGAGQPCIWGRPTFLLCPEVLLPGFLAFAEWDAVYSVEQCLGSSAWLASAHDCASQHGDALLVFCLSNLLFLDSAEEPMLREKLFQAARRSHILVQDVMLVISQLWAAGVPFAAVVPHWDDTALATLKRLPGVEWTGGPQCTLLHSVPEAVLPELLYATL